MRIDDETSFRIKVAAFVCSLMVTTIHCWSPHDWFGGASVLLVWQAAVAFLITDSVSRIAVPCFFVISGFFLAMSFMGQKGLDSANDLRLGNCVSWYAMTIRRRLHSLLIPFVLWNAFYVAIMLMFDSGEGFPMDTYAVLSKKILGWDMYVVPGCGQFWYLQTVILWVVASVVLLPLLYGRRWLQIGAIGVLFVVWALRLVYLPLPLAIGNFLWLMVGTALGLNYNEPRYTLNTRKKAWGILCVLWLLILAVVAKVYGGVMRNMVVYGWADKCIIILGVVILVGWVFMCQPRDCNYSLCQGLRGPLAIKVLGLSFFIYAFHAITISGAARTGRICDLSGFGLYLFKLCAAIIIPICVGLMARKCVPRLFAFICGGRV